MLDLLKAHMVNKVFSSTELQSNMDSSNLLSKMDVFEYAGF